MILRYLGSESTVPLSTILIATDSVPEVIIPLLRNLIDLSLIVAIDDNFAVATPIKAAISRIKGFLGIDVYERIAKELTAAFWSKDEAAPSLEIVDATLNAVARSGSTNFNPYQDLVRVSTVHRLAQECYYRKEWEQAREYAARAERMDSDRVEIKALYFKALVQLEKWTEANDKLNELQKVGHSHYFYLKGFMFRRQHRYADALKAFESAIDAGDDSYPLNRDYADCLHRLGRYDDARKRIQRVLQRDPENIFVLDLLARICIDGHLLDEAEKTIDRLQRCDIDERFIHHRKARFLSSKFMWENALAEAEAACNTGYSPFEAYAQRIDILIERNRFPEATEQLDNLKRKFRTHNREVQIGLHCKLLFRQGKWEEAKAVWDSLDNKTSRINLGMLCRILDLKSRDQSISLSQRQHATSEAEELRTRLGGADLGDRCDVEFAYELDETEV
jgi:tetratricopeptide (TPR) repeat protein